MSTEVEGAQPVTDATPAPEAPPNISTASLPSDRSSLSERGPSPIRPRGPPEPEALAPGLPSDHPFTPDQPGYSILLNGSTPSSHATRRASFAAYTGPSGSSASYVTGFAPWPRVDVGLTADALEGRGGPGARARADSVASSVTTDVSAAGPAPSVAESSTGTSTSMSTPSVRFAPLPSIPPELKRRSSITLGVAARKNLLSAQQGSAGPGAPGGGGVRLTAPMTDAEWATYKAGFSSAGPEPIDVGEALQKGARALWSKIRPGGTSPASQAPALPPKAGATPPRRTRSLSNNSAPSPTGSGQSFASGSAKLSSPFQNSGQLHVLHEEEHDHLHEHDVQPSAALPHDQAVGSGDGDEQDVPGEGASDHRRASTGDLEGHGHMTPRGGSPPLAARPVRQEVLGFVEPRPDARPRRAPMSLALAARQDRYKQQNGADADGNGNGNKNGEGSRTPRRGSPPPSATGSMEEVAEVRGEGMLSASALDERRQSAYSARSNNGTSTPPRTPTRRLTGESINSVGSGRHRSGSYGSIEPGGGAAAAGRSRSGSKTGHEVADGLRYYLDRSMGT